jgi:hypothetical protein
MQPALLSAVAALALAALAPAPSKVVRQTKSFGTVTIDHRAHLARRTPCKSCHGPGPVSKLKFTPRTAHDTCIGCHRDEQRGPTGCRQCHVVPAPPSPASEIVAAAGAPGGAPGAPGLGPPATASVPPPASATEVVPARTESARVLALGGSMIASSDHASIMAPAAVFSLRDEHVLFTTSVELGSAQKDGRTLGLIGGGLVLPVHGRFNALAAVVGGVDAIQGPSVSLLPAVGLRAGVEWLGERYCAGLQVTGLTDLTRSRNEFNETIGGTSFSAMATVGIVLSAGQ